MMSHLLCSLQGCRFCKGITAKSSSAARPGSVPAALPIRLESSSVIECMISPGFDPQHKKVMQRGMIFVGPSQSNNTARSMRSGENVWRPWQAPGWESLQSSKVL
jgi:hypothetical protein